MRPWVSKWRNTILPAVPLPFLMVFCCSFSCLAIFLLISMQIIWKIKQEGSQKRKERKWYQTEERGCQSSERRKGAESRKRGIMMMMTVWDSNMSCIQGRKTRKMGNRTKDRKKGWKINRNNKVIVEGEREKRYVAWRAKIYFQEKV